MKALLYLNYGDGKVQYISRIEDDYKEPPKPLSGSFLVVDIVDDSLLEYTGEMILKLDNENRYHLSTRREITYFESAFQTFTILRKYNKELHRLYDEPEAVARFNHVLEGLKVSPMNFLQYVLDNPEQK